MKNLYEVLEVSQNASKEVIEKAYKVLAKKYHPDVQITQEDKKIAEVKMKEINDAYDILSDEVKRQEYDKELQYELDKIEEEKFNEKIQDISIQSDVQPQYENKQDYEVGNVENLKDIQKEINKAYGKAYRDYLRSRGYKIKEPWTWKRFLKLLEVIGIIIVIIIILWFLPPTHKIIMDFYEGNPIVKTIVDIIGNIFKGIGDGFANIFGIGA